MTLDRWIALAIMVICLVYGYTAFFTMDALLPPFMRRNPILPSTLPKILAFLGFVTSFAIALGIEKTKPSSDQNNIDYRRLAEYKLGQTLALIAAMVAYALLLRPAGFILSTTLFLVVCSLTLGERKIHILIPISAVSALGIWYLVQGILDIVLQPWPFLLS